jgi:8-oxo-dGTP pyrophosphatase MutT (NUDIX family)
MTIEPHGPALRTRLMRHLTAHRPQQHADPGRRAAVAITVVPGHGGHAEVLVIMRSSRGRTHTGQFALPGGRLDAGESAADAARRELAEELDVDLPVTAVLGRLDDRRTASGFTISPFVLWAQDPVQLTPAPAEVAEVFRLPVHELDRDAEQLDPTLPSGFPALGTVIYAPTGAILLDFREVALHGRPPPDAAAWEPPFVRR